MTNYTTKRIPCARPPKLYMWAREVLYLGVCPARQQPRRSTQEKLILSLDGTLNVLTGDGRKVGTRSCLIPSGLWIDDSVLDASQAVVAIYHLAPFSQDYAAMSRVMTPAADGVHYDHCNEQAAVQAAIDIRDGRWIPPAQARDGLRARLLPPRIANRSFREFDRRVVHVARRIRESLFDGITLTELAAEVHLSLSRLEKLFKQQAGLPITQYRMRYRVFIATILMALGHSMTDAALYAGFSNSAHLSRSYRTLNGITPSEVFLRPPFLEPVIDDTAMDLVLPLIESTMVP